MALGLTIGSLCSGIGGLELGLERAGVGRVSWFCEADTYCRRVLGRHWPGVPIFPDIREIGDVGQVSIPIGGLDLCDRPPPVDVLSAGFPCQDLSVAGKGAGIYGAKSGLFFEVCRVARLLEPRFMVLENVPAIRRRGLSVVLSTVADLGYDAVWGCFSAGDVGSPQRRLRWWLVAYSDGWRLKGEWEPEHGDEPGARGDLSNGCDPGRRWAGSEEERGEAISRLGRALTRFPERLDPYRWPAAPGDQYAWEPPRTREREPGDVARLRALGNAVVPQCAFVVGHWVVRIHRNMSRGEIA